MASSPHTPTAAGQVALVLIPGMLNTTAIWRGVVARLQETLGETARIHVVDVTVQSTTEDMASDAWQCVQDLPAETPCFVAGFSMGGYVALEMLADQRRPLAGAWLVSTSPRPESASTAPHREQAIAALAADFEGAIQATARYGTYGRDAEQLEPLLQMMREVGSATAIRQTRAIMQRRDLRDRIRTLSLPVQVLCGEDDRITPKKLSEELAALVPGATLQLVPHAGHMLPWEQPDLIADAMGRALAASAKKGAGACDVQAQPSPAMASDAMPAAGFAAPQP
ncbi:alpha/beta fold hydrolase [Acidovorax sp. SRB_24]|uniref:alpha/beta fold hydrolase n=1 Tax=Acidovorax sp. SRB_24 TaxID=1962700 RepID=UPI00145EBFC9|nr:alpha/beta hydrolase [Acidovorax sp. SRB_24]